MKTPKQKRATLRNKIAKIEAREDEISKIIPKRVAELNPANSAEFRGRIMDLASLRDELVLGRKAIKQIKRQIRAIKGK